MINISVVVPIFNEEKNILALLSRIQSTLNLIDVNYEILFCADPCTDNSIEIILDARKRDPRIKLLVMSRRFGQPAATLAGLMSSIGEVAVVIDADLQDPPELISQMYQKFLDGYDVVHTRRAKRLGENWLRIGITHVGYWLINKLSYTDIPRNTGDFKLLSRKVLNQLVLYTEFNLFIRGLISSIGFRQCSIEYVRDARYGGDPHYSQIWGSIPQALNGIFCYSNKPLHYITLLGFFSATLSFISIVFFVAAKLFGAPFASGIPSILICISFFSGLILFSLGVIGEYIGRIFDEVKNRPRYIIECEFL